MTDDLEQTVSGASRGDARAVESLLARFLPGLRGYIARNAGQLVQAKESSSDLAQSVCREVLERLGDERLDYRGEAEFKQWLYQAAVHKLQNRHRFYKAERRDAGREDDGSRFGAAFGDIGTPSREAMSREDGEAFDRAFAELPEQHQEVIRLARLEGLSHAGVAERLGVTESHSRVLLARAMAKLARLVQRDAGDPEKPA